MTVKPQLLRDYLDGRWYAMEKISDAGEIRRLANVPKELTQRQRAMIAGFNVEMFQQLRRGHRILGPDSEGNYVYADDGTDAEVRRDTCGRCGRADTPEGFDGCLGEIAGLEGACCGHGNIEECYVDTGEGVVLRGQEAENWLKDQGVTRWRLPVV